MYLTQIMLANTVGINYIIADCQRMHTLVMSGFPSGDSETPRSDMAVLHVLRAQYRAVRKKYQCAFRSIAERHETALLGMCKSDRAAIAHTWSPFRAQVHFRLRSAPAVAEAQAR